ncbi:MAG: twin-arginine translocation signal domain-containing protein [Candidatus Obscuribacterales bacterium]|nr:twin-arginine translocation signal domain-containing protein [Steroidobacteraceae bacterium]
MPKLTRREFITATTAMGGALAIPTARGADAKTDAALNARTNLTGARRTLGYTLNVNGAAHRVALDPRVTLLDALREHIGLTGSKKGCDHGGRRIREPGRPQGLGRVGQCRYQRCDCQCRVSRNRQAHTRAADPTRKTAVTERHYAFYVARRSRAGGNLASLKYKVRWIPAPGLNLLGQASRERRTV